MRRVNGHTSLAVDGVEAGIRRDKSVHWNPKGERHKGCLRARYQVVSGTVKPGRASYEAARRHASLKGRSR